MDNFFQPKRAPIIILLFFGFFALGAYVGHYSKSEPVGAPADFSSTATPLSEEEFSIFWKVWEAIDEKYPQAGEVGTKERIYGAINGLVAAFDDPYTIFFDPEETKMFEADISGNFSGVGMEVGKKEGILTVIAPLKGTPAERAGIQAGDKILQIDDTNTTGLSVEKAVSLIRGEEGTSVKLTIRRGTESDPREITVVRDIIEIPTLETEILARDGSKIFVIKLYGFSANSTGLFRSALREFANAKTDKLILDLRGNPGGYLNAAVDISSWFLPAGKVVAIEDFGDEKEEKLYRSKGYNVFRENLKFVILIDGGSASASEIVAGAMRDHGLAKLVGEKSYGKGSVQEVVNITPATLFKVTVAKWLTPNESLIDGVGLTPEFEVELTQEDAEAGRDPQMDKAVEVLNSWQ